MDMQRLLESFTFDVIDLSDVPTSLLTKVIDLLEAEQVNRMYELYNNQGADEYV